MAVAAACDTRASHSTNEPVVAVRGLRKRYGRLDAVVGVDLEVYRGEIFAFLGPNGAGKTTTVEILEGFRARSEGTVSVLGGDPAHGDGAWRNRVGAVLQESQPEPGLTVRECLQLYAGYYAEPREIAETIALVGPKEKADTLGEQLSGGQRRRLDVALALIGDPELIFLDEPTTGFDPSARRTAWSVIEGLRSLGKTVFLTTHYMDEAEQLADRIAVIAAGRIVATARRPRSADATTWPPPSDSRCRIWPTPAISRRSCARSPSTRTGSGSRLPPRRRSFTSAHWASGRLRAASTCPTSTFAGRRSKTSISS